MSELSADHLDEERSAARRKGPHIREPGRAQVELGVSGDVIAESRIAGCAVGDRML